MKLALAFRSPVMSDEEQKVEVAKALGIGADVIPLPSRAVSDLGKFVLLGKSKRLSGVLGISHPFFKPGQVHLSTRDGLNSIIGRLRLGQIDPVNNVTTETLEGSAAILGGPVANVHARLIYGIGGVSPLLGVPLPVTFEYLSQIEEAMRNREEPWSIVVNGIASTEEVLLITSLPMGDDDRLINIAGLHGAGTRAIDLILKNEELLEKLDRATRNLTAWQAIFEVFIGKNDFERPRGVGEFKVFEICNANFGGMRYPLRNELFLTDARVAELTALLPHDDLTNIIDSSAMPLHRNIILDKISQDSQESCLVGRKLQSNTGAAWRYSHIGAAPGSPKTEEKQMGAPFLVGAKRTVLVPTSEDDAIRRGRPRKDFGEPAAAKFRRLGMNLTERDFERIEKLRSSTNAATVSDVVRDALRVYEAVVDAVAAGKNVVLEDDGEAA